MHACICFLHKNARFSILSVSLFFLCVKKIYKNSANKLKIMRCAVYTYNGNIYRSTIHVIVCSYRNCGNVRSTNYTMFIIRHFLFLPFKVKWLRLGMRSLLLFDK